MLIEKSTNPSVKLTKEMPSHGQVKEHGSLPNHIARTFNARRSCLGRSKSSILI